MKKQIPTDEPLSYHKILSLDVDAFLWISVELERIWETLIIAANNPDYEAIQRIAAEMYCIVDESKQFAVQSMHDLEMLEKEAGGNEQDPINSGDG